MGTGGRVSRQALYFTGPREVELRNEPMPRLAPDQLLVETWASAISAGTEMLVYRGQAPREMATDATISALAGSLDFPLKYGYAAVGQVVDVGREIDDRWYDQLVFAFNPHETRFVASPNEVHPVPTDLTPKDATLLPTMETALNVVMDGRPVLGEQVAVFGQGVVGLLTTALLGAIPLSSLVTLDRYPVRREVSLELGATASLDPAGDVAERELQAALRGQRDYAGADLTYELSGSPAALDQAIAATGFNGRIVVGSWYGQKRAPLDLGGHFHRSRIRLISSQVSTIAPEFSGRWSKSRRLDLAWYMLQRMQPADALVTHQFPFERAAEAYRLLDERPGEAIQVLLTY